MEAIEKLYQAYLEHVAELRNKARRLNSLYPKPSEIEIRQMDQAEFNRYLNDGRGSAAKRRLLLRILGDDAELKASLPRPLKILATRRAA